MSDIQMDKGEIAAFNVLNGTVERCETAHQDAVEARGAYLKLVGIKYHAVFDQQTGRFIPIDDEDTGQGE